jgi:hypothetical protein
MKIKSGLFVSLGSLLIALCWALPAQAVLTDPVSVSLQAPGGIVGDATPLSFTQTAALSTGVTPGDGSDIGSFMLPAESIAFNSGSYDLVVKIAAGCCVTGPLVTGYLGAGALPAQYVFDDLTVAGATITGYSALVTGLNSPTNNASFIKLLSPSSLSVELDNLVFTSVAGGQSNALATVDIHLITQAVPEPASVALALAGLMVIVMVRRTR